MRSGKQAKILFATQAVGGAAHVRAVHQRQLEATYGRFIERRLREEFGFVGTPIVIEPEAAGEATAVTGPADAAPDPSRDRSYMSRFRRTLLAVLVALAVVSVGTLTADAASAAHSHHHKKKHHKHKHHKKKHHKKRHKKATPVRKPAAAPCPNFPANNWVEPRRQRHAGQPAQRRVALPHVDRAQPPPWIRWPLRDPGHDGGLEPRRKVAVGFQYAGELRPCALPAGP